MDGEKRPGAGPGKRLGARVALLCLGFGVMALGVALSIRAELGTSPVSSVPYVAAAASGLTVGTATIIVNTLFVLLQVLILRRRFQWFQLLQIPAATLFGVMIDLWGLLTPRIPCGSYPGQWALCLLGIFFVGVGVSLQVTAKLITAAGEGLVLTLCKVLPVRFGTMKVAFDLSLVVLAAAGSLLFCGELLGVREGTAAAALGVGTVVRFLSRPMKRLEAALG